MKTLRLAILSFLLLSGLQLLAQVGLPNSQRNSSEVHIYKLTKDDLQQVHLKDKGFNEDMLQVLVAQYTQGEPIPVLPRGNYVIVDVQDNKLNYSEYTVDGLYSKIIPAEEFVIYLYDSIGTIITDAEVKRGSSKLKFDAERKVYSTKKAKDEQVVEINNRGVYHYVKVGYYDHYSYNTKNIFQSTWSSIKRLWYNTREGVHNIFNPSDRPTRYKYTGFVVFSKPKYKPGETVKMKGYMAELSGKPYNKAIDIQLYSGTYFNRVDTVLTKLEPYRPGMYSYEFKLSEDLDMRLDNNYLIYLNTGNERNNKVSGSFKYEDYELKSSKFSLTANKEEYVVGDSIKLKMKATDENDMAMYDGKVDVVITPGHFDENKLMMNSPVFIADTLWTHTIYLTGKSEEELVIPDSIFPPSMDMKFRVECSYLSADNEKRVENKLLSRLANEYAIDFSLEKGMLTVKELYKGESQSAVAKMKFVGEFDETLSLQSMTLPHTVAVPWLAGKVQVETANAKREFLFTSVSKPQLSYKFYRSADSVYLDVDNPAEIPFWYAIRKSKKELASGYTTQLNFATKEDAEEGYNMQLTYLFGQDSKQVKESLPFLQKNMSMEVSTPTRVYPGQTSNVLVSVKDNKGQPVRNADITAYSFTSKFESSNIPNVNVRGKAKYAKEFAKKNYSIHDSYKTNAKSDMAWDQWKVPMALDTIEYYRFLHPDTYYTYTEPTADSTTQIAPYVVIDGVPQGVHMLWIDENLYYSSQTSQTEVYTFELEPGRHNIRFRTYDREIKVHNIHVIKGCKNIISFNGGKPYVRIPYGDDKLAPFVMTSKLLSKKERGMLSANEESDLKYQLITVDNNFGGIILPVINLAIEYPAYIKSGNTLYFLSGNARTTYNHTLRGNINSPILAGPFPTRGFMNGLSGIASMHLENQLLANFEIEGGNKYTFYKDYQKIKNWDRYIVKKNISAFAPTLNFGQQLMTVEEIDRQVAEKIRTQMITAQGYAEKRDYMLKEQKNKHRLTLTLGKDGDGKAINPSLIFIVPQKEEDRKDYRLYYGGTRSFFNLPVGDVDMILVFNDSTSYTQPLAMSQGGRNYLKIDSVAYTNKSEIAKTAYNIFNRNVIHERVENPFINATINADSIQLAKNINEGNFRKDNALRNIISGRVYDDEGEALIGATVVEKGTRNGVYTDFDGRFEIEIKEKSKLRIEYIGFTSKEIDTSEGYDYTIVMESDKRMLNEVVVIGYGTNKRKGLANSSSVFYDQNSQILQGRVSGLSIGGASSSSAAVRPMLIVDGLPYDGAVEDLDTQTILSIDVLKDASATSIYGSRAGEGVIIIETNAFATKDNSQDGDEIPMDVAGNTMRRNFHDDAFWQPQLKTNELGEASFEVTYPDDITTWNAHFIAIGNKKQSDSKQMSIKSFKALSARLSLPRFAIRGDSLNAVGRIANHFGDSIRLKRTIDYNGDKQLTELAIEKSHVDYIPVKAEVGDSLTLAYSLQMQNGYFDGEERSLPILEQGMLQTHGDFKVIDDAETHILNTNPALGTVTLYAEASSLELFLREIDKIDKYPYMCNEQMASKIKMLLSKKQIYNLFDKKFKEDKKINDLIKKLNKNKNREGLWGWWNNSKTEVWISKQIVSAMLDAEEAGYKTEFDKERLAYAYEQQVKQAFQNIKLTRASSIPFAKEELLDRLILLKRLDASIDYKSYFAEIDKALKDTTTKGKMKTMLAMSSIGLADQINMDSLMHHSHKTMLGSMYWGDAKERNLFYRSYILPYENNIETTLIAYNILRNMGGHEDKLRKMRSYFFERRQGGSWQNTYESSRVVETIMPDMLAKDKSYAEVAMYVGDKKIEKFPHTEKAGSEKPIEIRKEGTLPLFVTAYQQEWNKNPKVEVSKGFKVNTMFKVNGDSIASLKTGKTTLLVVTIDVEADAEYVQIEVPIPAGCSYESKHIGNYWKEVHREHFKEKVVIFSNKLIKGKHQFEVELLPRYTGTYTLNPAKVELMYFPTFYGNEEVKGVRIE